MSEACTHDCSSCKSNCDHRAPQHEPPHARSRIQKVIGVVSGKGGVGKSMTSAMLAVSMRRLGFKAGVLDADITGPSIPRLFGVKGPATGDGESINPGFQPYRRGNHEHQPAARRPRGPRCLARPRHCGRGQAVLAGGRVGR